MQTAEGQPVLVHAGPFGNIAHGCNSVIADRIALGYADYVVTEAGFGADLGFEKFMHIKARFNDLEPHAAVLVASVRALKSHGGVPLRQLETPDVGAVKRGLPNLEHLITMIKSFGLPVVVALNYFPSDTAEEMAVVRDCAEAMGASAAESHGFAEGGAGCEELGQALIDATDGPKPSISYVYAEDDSIEDKVNGLARVVYGADGAQWNPVARRTLRRYEELGWGKLPVCMAKTHLSISHNPALKGRPSGYTFEVSDVRASVGAGFIYPLAGSMVTMPGLPSTPRRLDVDNEGNILGL